MSKDHYVFSRNTPYALGGAENSLFIKLKNSNRRNIKIVYAKQNNLDNKFIPYESDDRFSLQPLPKTQLLSRYFYLEYYLNKLYIERFFATKEVPSLWAQNRWAPAAVNTVREKHPNAEIVYFQRDQSSYGNFESYYSGIKNLAKWLYMSSEAVFRKAWVNEQLSALRNSDKVIANSNFMATKIEHFAGVKCDIDTPPLPANLAENYQQEKNSLDKPNAKPTVTMFGNTHVKGIYLLREIASSNPNYRFVVYGHIDKPYEIDNISYRPWTKNIARAYAEADVVLVPSVWEEAYGRVAAEAYYLNIPVIASNRGGLPEAVDHNEDFLANNINEFNIKLRRILES